jgi:hypothetical protein
MRQPLQELRRTALRHARGAVDDEVFLQPRWVDAGALELHCDTRVSPNVPNLLVLGQVSGNELVPVNPDPHAGHLRAAVSVQRDEMCERARFDELASAVRQRGHGAIRSVGATVLRLCGTS